MKRATHGLAELPVEERHGMIRVRTRPGGGIDLGQSLSGLETDLAAYRFDRCHHCETQPLQRH